MHVVCTGCSRRLEWSAKRDRRLTDLRCPHCGSDYKKPSDYQDWADPAHLTRRAEDAAYSLRLAVARAEEDLKDLTARLAALPQLSIAAGEALELLRAKLPAPARLAEATPPEECPSDVPVELRAGYQATLRALARRDAAGGRP